MDTTIFIAVLSVTAVGASCAVMLCIAAKVMHVKVDERVAQLQEIMPGINCGACGYPGCSGYAEALVSGAGVKTNLCTPGGAEVLARISAILGVEAESVVPKTAVVNCLGDSGSQQKKMEYKGIQSCQAAKLLFGGEGACAFGCLGYGDCQIVCPTDAVCMQDSLARIRAGLCTGCGLCVKACPNDLISIENASAPVFVMCKNIEKGAVVRKKCSKGCIGCGKCARECPEKAIVVENSLARIDYAKCSGCGHCVQSCVAKCIKPGKPAA
ncbi:MAG: RnfABCDGE type electron transport complex subunit B [Treponema sp.]|nr:RnfABCDGE type electron transport complex subunit B [Treponema sp.]